MLLDAQEDLFELATPRASQDDTYTESYISTIGVDFVSAARARAALGWPRALRGRPRCVAAGAAVAVVGCAWCVRTAPAADHLTSTPLSQKIRTVELDGKVIKLQIVSCAAVLRTSGGVRSVAGSGAGAAASHGCGLASKR